MGGSLAGALQGQCRTVVGVDRDAAVVETALDRGMVDQGTTELANGVKAADIVILATPVRVILRLLDEIGPLLRESCLLMDVGSTKTQILQRMASLPGSVEPLGGHPMCGKELSGIAAAEPGLYQGQPFILSPLARTSAGALGLGRAVVEAVGAKPLLLSAEQHDRLVATISHLPYLVACGLVGAAEESAARDALVWLVAASGFRDTSRLAAGDVTMMLDILMTNQAAVAAALETFEVRLHRLTQLVAQGNEAELRLALGALRARRKEMFA
jgi:prephenate dehydrogenase